MRQGRINEGCPPTTHEWNEFERRQEPLPGADRLRMTLPKGTPKPLPEATPEQITGTAARLYIALRLCVEALDREPWDGRWGNRLMQAHTYGHGVLEYAAQWTQPEEHSGTPLPSDADHRSVVGRQAEGGE
jgi:hypothetical protein